MNLEFLVVTLRIFGRAVPTRVIGCCNIKEWLSLVVEALLIAPLISWSP